MSMKNYPSKSFDFASQKSPITPQHMALGLKISDVQLTGRGHVVWLEERGAQRVLVVQPLEGGGFWDLNGTRSIGASVGYGGGDFTIHDNQVYFVDAESGRICRQSLIGGEAIPITPAFGDVASPCISPNGQWMLFVRSYAGEDTLEVMDTQGNFWPQKLVSGEDYYMQPAWHPRGRMIAWVAWNAPNMPWDGTRLYLGHLRLGRGELPRLARREIIVGAENASVFQPTFSPDGRFLAYVSDESGWWQLYLYDLESRVVRQLTFEPAEHAQPAWRQGMRTYAFDLSGRRIYFLRNQNARVTLHGVDIHNGKERLISLGEDFTYLEQISVSRRHIALLASGTRRPTSVLTLSLPKGEANAITPSLWREMLPREISPQCYAPSERMSWRAEHGEVLHVLYYPPQNPNGQGRPPLILSVHGGPTSQRFEAFNLNAQFFTSRGFAYAELNHRGSTGYGRAYRELLRGTWGLVDVQDAVEAVSHLAQLEKADLSCAVIMGGSAGGYTVLRALQEHPGFFKAGIALFPVANLFTLAAETHKFEAHYLDTLIGPLPQARQEYYRRSPEFFVERMRDPLALFQGEEDKVVPRSQSDAIATALREHGVPLVYHTYPGEGHGFRKPETIAHMYAEIEKFLKGYVLFR